MSVKNLKKTAGKTRKEDVPASKNNDKKNDSKSNNSRKASGPNEVDQRKYTVTIHPLKKTNVDENRRTVDVLKRVIKEASGSLVNYGTEVVDHRGLTAEIEYNPYKNWYDVRQLWTNKQWGCVQTDDLATYTALACKGDNWTDVGTANDLHNATRLILRYQSEHL
jgi:NDP-sugar pyrophosphorylase family protein